MTWTHQEIANGADWEGSLHSLVRWGLSSSEVPEDLRDDWKILEAAKEAEDRLAKKLPEPM